MLSWYCRLIYNRIGKTKYSLTKKADVEEYDNVSSAADIEKAPLNVEHDRRGLRLIDALVTSLCLIFISFYEILNLI